MTFIIIIHVIVCAVLIGLVLIQRGRGGGLVESFQGVESMFGTKTSTFLTRTTTILSILFFITCLSLAVLSVRQSRSLMRDVKAQNKAASTPIPQQADTKTTKPAELNTQPQTQAQAETKAQTQTQTPKTEQK